MYTLVENLLVGLIFILGVLGYTILLIIGISIFYYRVMRFLVTSTYQHIKSKFNKRT